MLNAAIGPVGTLSAAQVRRVLTAAASAPSLHDLQPWRFHCTPTAIQLHAVGGATSPGCNDRELLLGCGAALLNLRLAIRALGVATAVRLLPDPQRPDLLALLWPQGYLPPVAADRVLASAVLRRPARRAGAPTPLPATLWNELRQAARMEQGWMATLADEQLPALRQLVDRADQIGRGHVVTAADAAVWSGRDRASDFGEAPLMAAIGTFQDGKLARLHAGQSMQRVLLTAATMGLSASFLSQVVEVPTTRIGLRDLIGGGLWPQVLLQLTDGPGIPPSARRTVEELLVDA